MLGPDAMRNELTAIRAHTTKPFNVNFFCHTPPQPDAAREAAWRTALAGYYAEFRIEPPPLTGGAARLPFDAETADVLSQFKPPVVSFHFGLPSAELLARVRSWGAKILASATTVEEALWLERNGVDAVIAQGLEAGGHRGMFLPSGDGPFDLDSQLRLWTLLPSILHAVRVPVIAAGGIGDAQGVATALRLGASAVQLGTAFLLCPEATTSAVHRAALQGEGARQTALTNLFSGRPARGIVNRLMREMGPISTLPPAFPSAVNAIAPLRAAAEQAGRGDFSPLWAGQHTRGCRAIPAAQLVRELAGASSPADPG